MILNIGDLYLIALIILSSLTSTYFVSRNFYKSLWLYKSIYIQFCIITAAILQLMTLYLSSNYSYINIALNTHALVPILYKVTGIWGNHEGSMLLMLWLLCVINILFMTRSHFSETCKKQILALQSFVVALISCFVFFVSDPFAKTSLPLANGYGFNPLLQDYTLAIHPPILYYGYIGLSIVFSCLIVGLRNKTINQDYLRHLYPWISAPLGFLTLGIALGAWWAYRELGWGGFWFWDPVENVSLMIWCITISLLHVAKLSLKRDCLYRWTTFLGILSFILTILSLFLVRSGALVSVHSFAIDQAKGVGLFLVLLTITIMSVFFWLKYQKFIPNTSINITFFNKDSGVILQNLFTLTVCLIILISLLYPVFLGIFTNKTVSVGELFYTDTLQFIFLPTVFLMITFPFLKSSKDNLKKNLASISTSLISATLVTIAINSSKSILNLGTNLYILASIACIISILINGKSNAYKKAPMLLGHLGFALLILGASFCWSWQYEENIILSEKQNYKNSKKHEIILEKILYQKSTNYLSRTATISLYKDNKLIGKAMPETRFYPIEQTFTHESSIVHTGYGDFYFTIGEITKNGSLSIKIKHKPFVYLVWCGSVLLAIGVFLGIFTSTKKDANNY